MGESFWTTFAHQFQTEVRERNRERERKRERDRQTDRQTDMHRERERERERDRQREITHASKERYVARSLGPPRFPMSKRVIESHTR